MGRSAGLLCVLVSKWLVRMMTIARARLEQQTEHIYTADTSRVCQAPRRSFRAS